MTGPLAPYAEAYQAELRVRGYTALSAVNELRQVGRLSGWLDARGMRATDLSAGRVEEFLADQRSLGSDRSSWSRPGLLCMVEVLRALRVVGPDQPGMAPSAEGLLLDSFGRYLLVERGLVPGTVRGYVDHARRFLACSDGAGGLGLLSAVQVTAAVLRESAGVSVATTQNFVAGLKAFLRFCFVEGLIDVDLSAAALAITGRRRSSLPGGSPRRTPRRCSPAVTAAARWADGTMRCW